MKKRIIIGAIIIIVIAVIALCIFKSQEDEYNNLVTYPGNIVCTMKGTDKIDGSEIPYETRVYITTSDDYVTSAVYQTITYDQNENVLNAILKIYNEIDGITMFTDKYDDYNVLTIKHDYNKIDLKQVEEKLGDLLDDSSLFKRYKKFPINYGEYKAVELKGYECHEN